MAHFNTIRYETTDSGVARIVLSRPEQRNAQSRELLTELNSAFNLAAHDNDVRVIVLAADGPDFSSGHNLGPETNFKLSEYTPVGTWGGFDLPGPEGAMAAEHEFFLGFSWRWRNIPKPTIAEVHGWVIAGGLMLMWPCDIVIASEDARFSDPVVAFGVNGVEYFAHPWELGVRKAKEMLFTGDVMNARDAKAAGMLNHVVPREELTSFTMAMAERIAERPMMGLKLAKQSVNQMQDAQGFWEALQGAMSLQQLGHAHNRVVHGIGVDPSGAQTIRQLLKAYTSG